MTPAEYIVIFILCALAVFIIYSISKERIKDREAEAAKAAAVAAAVVHKPVPVTVTDQESADAKYAVAHNMWVCAYCETLNPCPAGMKRIADSPRRNEPAAAANGLRGDLFNKVNDVNAGIITLELQCAACEKTQKVSS